MDSDLQLWFLSDIGFPRIATKIENIRVRPVFLPWVHWIASLLQHLPQESTHARILHARKEAWSWMSFSAGFQHIVCFGLVERKPASNVQVSKESTPQFIEILVPNCGEYFVLWYSRAHQSNSRLHLYQIVKSTLHSDTAELINQIQGCTTSRPEVSSCEPLNVWCLHMFRGKLGSPSLGFIGFNEKRTCQNL